MLCALIIILKIICEAWRILFKRNRKSQEKHFVLTGFRLSNYTCTSGNFNSSLFFCFFLYFFRYFIWQVYLSHSWTLSHWSFILVKFVYIFNRCYVLLLPHKHLTDDETVSDTTRNMQDLSLFPVKPPDRFSINLEWILFGLFSTYGRHFFHCH